MAKLLWIVGSGRSGSTVLSALLGSIPGVLSIGETLQLERPLSRPVDQLDPLWAAALEELGEEGSSALRTAIARLARSTATASRLRPQREDLEAIAAFYERLAAIAGARVIVESSKAVRFALQMDAVRSGESAYVHLLRDPRGVVASYQRSRDAARRAGRSDSYYGRSSLTVSCLRWIAKNAVVSGSLAWRRPRRLLLRYDEVITEPRVACARIGELLGLTLDEPRLQRSDSGFVLSTGGSIVSGNRGVVGRQTLELRRDTRWRQELRGRAWVELLTALPRWAYRL